MKNFALVLSFICVVALGAPSQAASPTAVEVIAKEKAGGKVVYHGQTGANGKFATKSLAPGSYVFEFASKDGSGFQVALAGAKNARQVKAKGASLAFAVEVGSASAVSGQITPLKGTAVVANAKSNANVKVINGRRYVYVRGETGSHIGGKWIPEEEAEATNPTGSKRSASEMLTKMQDMGGQGGSPGN